jgi:hypothetical protein
MSRQQAMPRSRAVEGARDPGPPILMVVLPLLSLAGAAGAVQLIAGVATPPVDDLAPLGLSSWVLPGIWLMMSVAVPSAVATVALRRRSPRAGALALLVAVLLGIELAVQIPFVGFSVLQLVLSLVGVVIAALALRMISRGGVPG